MSFKSAQAQEIYQREESIRRLQGMAARGSISDQVRVRCYWSIDNLRAVIATLKAGDE